MNRYASIAGVTLLALVASLSAGSAGATPEVRQTAGPAQAAPAEHRALLDQYCVTCHNQRGLTANLAFDTMDLAHAGEEGEVWEEAIRKLRGGMMPPPGARQPEREAVGSFVRWLEGTLDSAAAARPEPGYVALHRMNRPEYENAIRELFGIEVDADSLLPVDDISDGFSNIANVLKVSPSFLDQYISAARTVSIQAVGTPPPTEPTRMNLAPGDPDQNPYAPGGLPLGTEGALAQHFFPADAEYEFAVARNQTLIIDGVRIDGGRQEAAGAEAAAGTETAALPAPATAGSGGGGRGNAGGGNNQTIRVRLAAGMHTVSVAAPVTRPLESDASLQSLAPGGGGGRGRGGGGGIQVTGPFNPQGPVLETPRRQQLFVCRPPEGATPEQELACANEVLANVARKAFRRTVTERDLVAPLAFFREGRTQGDFEVGIQYGLTAILASPKFLYRAEPVPSDLPPGSLYRISDLELASRLSFFLWSQNPDDELLDLAADGRLSEPDVLEQQVRRMLADPRSGSLVTNFAFQWLNLGSIGDLDPDPVLFPNFDGALGDAFVREIELFVGSIVDEDRSVVDLLRADHTFVNERLAAHYGIPDIRGNRFRRVTLTDEHRWGLLGKSAILMVTSYPNRTAPVLRWILERILGTPPAAPPPDVEAFPETQEGEKALSVRERLEAHRANPSCNSCHGVMDPLGFALENFNAIGEWQTMDRYARTPIDASGQLVDGTPVSGPADLRQALASEPEQFVQTLTEKLLMFALGRTVEYYDMPVVRGVVREAAPDDYRMSSIVMGIVRSTPFQMKQVPLPESASEAEGVAQGAGVVASEAALR